MFKLIFCLSIVSLIVVGDLTVHDKNKKNRKIIERAEDPEGIMAMINKRAKELEAKSKDNLYEREMLPPWQIIPDKRMENMIWRMGSGEEYRNKFFYFFTHLSITERANYISQYPEPNGWAGYYDLILSR